MKNGILLVGLLLALTPMVFADGVPNCGVNDNYSVTLQSVVPLGNGNYNWTYQVCKLAGKDISHWVLGTCNCTGYTSNIGVCGTDASTGLYGLKFDSGDFTCSTFWFVGNNNYLNATTNAYIKAGNGYCTYAVTGPGCTTCGENGCGVPAPEFPSIALPIIVAAGAATFVYTLRRMS